VKAQMFSAELNQCMALPLSELGQPKKDEFPLKPSSKEKKPSAPGMKRDDIFTPPN